MRETYAEPALDGYLDSVTELMEAGQPFGAVEDAIEAFANLTEDVKAGLWLLAFSLRDRSEQVRDAHAYLASVA